MTSELPLVVDLDGTLVLDDTLVLMATRMLRRNPAGSVVALAHLARGRSNLKHHLWDRHPVEPSQLRWNQPLMAQIADEAANGRSIFLATGAPQDFADAVAAELPIFASVLGSNSAMNLTGTRKASVLVRRFGWRGFVYVGNSPADLNVWEAAGGAWVCSKNHALRARAAQRTTVLKIF